MPADNEKIVKLPAGLKELSTGRYEARITMKKNGKLLLDTQRQIEASGGTKAVRDAKAIRQFIALQDELKARSVTNEWTVQEAADDWIAAVKVRCFNSWSARRAQVRSLCEAFGPLYLSQVTNQMAQRWLAALPVGDRSSHVYRATLISIYKHAVQQGRLVGTAPVTFKREPPRDAKRELEAAEAAKSKPGSRAMLGDRLKLFFGTVRRLTPEMYVMARVQLILGVRWCEVAPLEKTHIDWKTGDVQISRGLQRDQSVKLPKGGEIRNAALGKIGLRLLKAHVDAMERAGIDSPYLFPAPGDERRKIVSAMWTYREAAKRWHKVYAACGIEVDALTHALRHSHASVSEAQKSDEISKASQEVMGHKQASTRAGYVDQSVADARSRARARAYAAAMERELDALAGGEAGGDVVRNLRIVRGK